MKSFISKILKILKQEDNEDAKYRQIVETLNIAIDLTEDISCKDSLEYRDFSVFLSNLLMYNFEKIEDLNAMVTSIGIIVERLLSITESTALFSEILNELENKYLELSLLSSKENIIGFLGQLIFSTKRVSFLKKSQINRIFEFFKTALSINQYSSKLLELVLTGLVNLIEVIELDQITLGILIENANKLSNEYDRQPHLKLVMAKFLKKATNIAMKNNYSQILTALENLFHSVC
jgi:hypothetical protein